MAFPAFFVTIIHEYFELLRLLPMVRVVVVVQRWPFWLSTFAVIIHEKNDLLLPMIESLLSST